MLKNDEDYNWKSETSKPCL